MKSSFQGFNKECGLYSLVLKRISLVSLAFKINIFFKITREDGAYRTGMAQPCGLQIKDVFRYFLLIQVFSCGRRKPYHTRFLKVTANISYLFILV